jgi:mercuric ion transport protein
MQPMTSEVASQTRNAQPARTAAAIGGVAGAIATASCCLLPFVLFALGASGAWIGALVRLAPLQPYFLAATIACLGSGCWLVYRSRRSACAPGPDCGTPATDKLVKGALVISTALVLLAIGFKFLIPLLDS